MSALGVPIRLRPEYRWAFITRDINEAYGRAMAMMDLATWSAEIALEKLSV